MGNTLPNNINELQKGLLNKKFSAVEIVEKYLARIRSYDKKLNAFITVTDELAYEQAKRTDKLIRGLSNRVIKQYPLLGVVVAHKDLFLTKGIRTTAASSVLRDYVPAYSATVVERLEKAGAIIIGKLNCDAWAHGSSGENSDFGATKNPWNSEYVPGGSSSGSGVSVAAGMALVATGTDTCGSIRLPANYCGVVGLKPTYGSVSRYGVVAMASSLDSIGHMARTVEDGEKVYGITKGEDGKDATLKNSSYPKLQTSKKITLGVVREFFGDGLDGEVKKNIEGVIEFYKKQDIEIVEVSLPSSKYGISVYYIIQPAEVSSNLARYDGVRYGNSRSMFGDEAKRRIMLGNYVLSAGYWDAYYLKAMKVRSVIINEVNEVFEKVDALIAPVAPTPPFRLGERTDDPLKMYLTDIYAAVANLSGIPSLAVPSGFSKKGLPLGFQLMGQRFSEPLLFKLGKLYQKETDWHLKQPDL